MGGVNISKLLKSYKFYLIIAFLLGVFIRLYRLDMQGLWFDELITVTCCTDKVPGLFKFWITRVDLHPPLYSLFLYSWIKYFGNSEIAVRLPSAIMGILSVFYTYKFSSRHFGKYIATSATTLLALSSAGIMYAQEARNYSFVLFLSVLSTFFWLDMIKKMEKEEATWKDFIGYGILCIISAFFHYYAAAFVCFQMFYLFLYSLKIKKYTKKVVIIGLDFLCLFIPWVNYHFSVINGINDGTFWVEKSNLISIGKLIDFIFNKKLIIFLLIPFLLKIKEFAVKEYKMSSPLVSLTYLVFAPIITFFVIGFFMQVFYARYFMIILPAAYVLISMLISFNPIFKESKGNAYVLAISLISLYLFLFVPGNNLIQYTKPFYGQYKQGWREATKYVTDNYDANSIVFVDRSQVLQDYYFSRYMKNKRVYMDFYDSIYVLSQLIRDRRQYFKRMFVMLNYIKLPPSLEDKLILESSSFVEKDYEGLTVYDFTLPPKK